MPSGSSSTNPVSRDDNRIIAIVTGANSGFGLGICKQLLSNLSLPPGTPLPASTPTESALAPSQRHLIGDHPQPTKAVSDDPSPILTLVLACRSQTRAEEAKTLLLTSHEAELQKRKEQGISVRPGWKEGLRIDFEQLDLETPGGKAGILSFCNRVKKRYPHVTLMFLNAGIAVYKGNDYPQFFKQVLRDGICWTLTDPEFNHENVGVRTSDGERGLCWSVNVLGPYIMTKELAPLLRRSPRGLPFSPRVIYTSSFLALYRLLHEKPMEDYQLLTYGSHFKDSAYKASKYFGDVVMVNLDRELSKPGRTPDERPVRVLTTEPGHVVTNIMNQGFGGTALYIEFMKFFWWLSFVFVRLLGSTFHPSDPTSAALAMLYTALIDDRYLQPSEKVPAQKFKVHSHRLGATSVDYGEVDRWEETLELGEQMVQKCEEIRLDWRRREGLD